MYFAYRHAQNLLVCTRTGSSVQIDFGHAFGSGFILPIPELVPFRMTPQIQTLMLPFKSGAGLARETMITALKAVKDNRYIMAQSIMTFAR